MNYLYLNPNNRIVLQSANGGYFGAPLAIQSVHYDGYHGVL